MTARAAPTCTRSILAARPAQVAAGRAVGSQFDALKAGRMVAPWLSYASCRREAGDAAGFSAHLRRRVTCDRCGVVLVCSLAELREHQARCTGPTPAGKSDGEPADAGSSRTEMAATAAPSPSAPVGKVAAAAEEAAQAEADGAARSSVLGKRAPWECEACGKVYLFTRPDILRHLAAHRQAAGAAPPADADCEPPPVQ